MEAGSTTTLSRRFGKKKGKKEEEDRAMEEDEKRKKKSSSSSSSGGPTTTMRCCQVDKCTADLLEAKAYHRRHRVCEHHSKAADVLVAGLHQRFCQQCSRFHELWEFDDAKRSCRRRLAGHNERRRKSAAAESQPRGVRAGQAEDKCAAISPRESKI